MTRNARRLAALVALAAASAGCPGQDSATRPSPSPVPPAPLPLPFAPAALLAMPGDGTVTLDWTAVPGAATYTAYVAASSGVSPLNYTGLPGGQRISGVARPLHLAGLTNGTPIHAVVTASTVSGEGPASPEAEATPAADCACPGW